MYLYIYIGNYLLKYIYKKLEDKIELIWKYYEKGIHFRINDKRYAT